MDAKKGIYKLWGVAPGEQQLDHRGTCFAVGERLLLTAKHVVWPQGVESDALSYLRCTDPEILAIPTDGGAGGLPGRGLRVRDHAFDADLVLLETDEQEPALPEATWVKLWFGSVREESALHLVGYPHGLSEAWRPGGVRRADTLAAIDTPATKAASYHSVSGAPTLDRGLAVGLVSQKVEGIPAQLRCVYFGSLSQADIDALASLGDGAAYPGLMETLVEVIAAQHNLDRKLNPGSATPAETAEWLWNQDLEVSLGIIDQLGRDSADQNERCSLRDALLLLLAARPELLRIEVQDTDHSNVKLLVSRNELITELVSARIQGRVPQIVLKDGVRAYPCHVNVGPGRNILAAPRDGVRRHIRRKVPGFESSDESDFLLDLEDKAENGIHFCVAIDIEDEREACTITADLAGLHRLAIVMRRESTASQYDGWWYLRLQRALRLWRRPTDEEATA